MTIECHLTVYLCSYCTRAFNAARESDEHEMACEKRVMVEGKGRDVEAEEPTPDPVDQAQIIEPTSPAEPNEKQRRKRNISATMEKVDGNKSEIEERATSNNENMECVEKQPVEVVEPTKVVTPTEEDDESLTNLDSVTTPDSGVTMTPAPTPGPAVKAAIVLVKCPECDKSFAKGKLIQAHIKRHYKPHKCAFCGKAYDKRNLCRTHEMIHTGERPLKCRYGGCEESFRVFVARKKHELSHEPYKCKHCDTVFKTEEEVKEHLGKHIRGGTM